MSRLLASLSTFIALFAFAGAFVGHAQESTQLRRLAIGQLTRDGVTSTQSGRSWRLAATNKATKIDAAYVYGNNVVVFGWFDCCVGIATIIDAGTATEKLEFLEYDPHITPKGLIIFRRFYPHFSDPSIVSDAIEELDLNRPIPHSVPEQPTDNSTGQIGRTVYPLTPTSNVRHEIEHNFLAADGGTLLFIADRLSTGELCLARLPLAGGKARESQRNCLTGRGFGAPSLSAVHIRQFSEDTLGELILSVDIGEPNSSVQRNFHVNEDSLIMTP